MNNKKISRLSTAIERLNVHDHLCLIYETQEEQFAAVVPFIRSGLKKGEKCVYIVDDNTAAEVINAMRAGGINIDSAVKSGALAIINKQDAYLKQGHFDPDWMIGFLKDAADLAKKEGYSCLRATGEMTWMLGGDPGVERLMEYEAKLNYFLPENDVLAICQYSRKRFSPEVIMDVISTHPMVIYGGLVCRNSYYVPPDDFLSSREVSRDVERLLENIVERENAENALQESEKRFSLLAENARDMIYRMSLPDGKYEYVSPASKILFGYSPDEFYRSPILIKEVIHPAWREYFEEQWSKLVAGNMPPFYEYQIVHKSGETRWVNQRNALIRNDRGMPVAIEGIVTDITERKQAEEAFIEQTRTLDLFFKYTLTQMVILDRNFNFIRVNEAYAKACRRDVSEFPGHNHFEFYPSDAKAIFERVVETKEPFQTIARPFIFPDHPEWGVTYWDWTLTPILDNTGEVKFLIFSLIDVTERKKTEEELRLSERNLAEAQFLTHTGSHEYDVLNDRLCWSDEVFHIFGISPQDFTGKVADFFDRIHPDDRERVKKTIEEAIEQKGTGDFEHRIIRSDGTVRIVHELFEAIYDENGQRIRHVGTIQDITEHKQAEEKLKFLASIMQNIPEAVCSIEKEGILTSWNEGAEKMLGYKAEEIIGKPITTIIPEEIAQKELEHCINILNTEGSLSGYASVRIAKDGRMVPVEIIAMIMKDDVQNITGYVSIMIDMTEHKKLEDQLRQAQKMEAIGNLAGGVAHDFNNILSAIMGYASLTLMEMKEDDPLTININEILHASDRATVLTQSLLAFSRKQTVILKLININDLLKKFEKFLQRLIREDIELRVICTDVDLAVMVDSGQIEQVLMNLVTNARDVMPNGGKLNIESRPFELDKDFVKAHGYGKLGRYALISVTDTGTGIDEKIKAKIFEPFFTTKEVGKGTGLGLAMVYGIVKKHEGYINVYSEPGKGTTFRIYLPIAGGTAQTEEEEKKTTVPLKGGTETILVAEDDVAIRKLLNTVLTHFGYKVIEAVDGEEAIQKFIENKDSIQLVMLDGIMPKKNGVEAYENIKIISHDIKAIFMSGYSENVLSGKDITEEGLEFLFKPVAPKDLLKKVREVLDK